MAKLPHSQSTFSSLFLIPDQQTPTLPNPPEVGTLHTFSPVASQNKVVACSDFALSASCYGFGKCVGDCEEWQSRPALLSQVSDRCYLVIFFSALFVANVLLSRTSDVVYFFLGKTCFVLYLFLKWSQVSYFSESASTITCHDCPSLCAHCRRAAQVRWSSDFNNLHPAWLGTGVEGPKSSSKQFDVANQILFTWLPPLQVVEWGTSFMLNKTIKSHGCLDIPR